MAHEMSREEIAAFLSHGTRTANLATTMRDGSPHVMPVWFLLEGEEIVFNTGAGSVKGRNLRRDPRVSISVDDQAPPYSFVHVRGRATLSEDPDELLRTATLLAVRYIGADRAEEFGRRNATPGELVVRVAPERIIALAALAD